MQEAGIFHHLNQLQTQALAAEDAGSVGMLAQGQSCSGTSDNTEIQSPQRRRAWGSPWELTAVVSTQHSRQRRPKAKTWWGERSQGQPMIRKELNFLNGI